MQTSPPRVTLGHVAQLLPVPDVAIERMIKAQAKADPLRGIRDRIPAIGKFGEIRHLLRLRIAKRRHTTSIDESASGRDGAWPFGRAARLKATRLVTRHGLVHDEAPGGRIDDRAFF